MVEYLQLCDEVRYGRLLKMGQCLVTVPVFLQCKCCQQRRIIGILLYNVGLLFIPEHAATFQSLAQCVQCSFKSGEQYFQVQLATVIDALTPQLLCVAEYAEVGAQAFPYVLFCAHDGRIGICGFQRSQ